MYKILGMIIGCDVTPGEVWEAGFGRLRSRIGIFCEGHMSMAARIISSSVFFVCLFSYVGRVLLAPSAVQDRLTQELRNFILPVPVVKLALLAHLTPLFQISVCAQDIY